MSQQKIVKEILVYIKVDAQKRIAYRHWERIVNFLIEENNKNWESTYKKLRSVISIDYRYINDYINSLLEWNIIKINGDILHFLGVPKTECVECQKEIKEGSPFNRCLECNNKILKEEKKHASNK